MLIGRLLLITLMRSTFIICAALTNTTTGAVNHRPTNPPKHSSLPAVPYPVSLAANQNECQQPCSIDYCLKYLPLSRNCTKLVRDACDCCTVCLRAERQVCGGYLNVHGLCEQDLLCHKSNRTLVHSTGICIRGKSDIRNKIDVHPLVSTSLSEISMPIRGGQQHHCLPVQQSTCAVRRRTSAGVHLRIGPFSLRRTNARAEFTQGKRP